MACDGHDILRRDTGSLQDGCRGGFHTVIGISDAGTTVVRDVFKHLSDGMDPQRCIHVPPRLGFISWVRSLKEGLTIRVQLAYIQLETFNRTQWTVRFRKHKLALILVIGMVLIYIPLRKELREHRK